MSFMHDLSQILYDYTVHVQLFCDPVDCSMPSFPLSSPGTCSNSCPFSQWCHPTISFSVVHFSFCLQSFPVLGSFLISQLFLSGGQSFGASASVLPMNTQGLFPLDWSDLLAVEVTNRFKGLYLVNRMPEEVHKIIQEGVAKIIPQKKKCKTWHNVSKVHSFCSMHQKFFFFFFTE